METWKPVPSVPGLEASNHGRVRCKSYLMPMPHGGVRERSLAPTYGYANRPNKSSTYERMIVRFRGRTYKIHRLVCEAFSGSPPSTHPVAMHLNENSKDNDPSNISWGTQRENLNAPGFLKYCRTRRAA